MNTIVVIKNTKYGFEIIIHNIPNKEELDNLLYWISKIISSSQEKIKVTRGANKDSSERSPNGLSSQDAKSTKAANKSF